MAVLITREDWKSEGDRLCRMKEFYQAILCYDEALRRTNNESDAQILLLNRCHARVCSQHFDSALEDAKSVLQLSPNNEKALFRTAKALYGLRRFGESAHQLTKLLKLHPKNQDAARDLERCHARLREELGNFDFKAMLDEAVAKYPKSEMDRADYLGPIEARICPIKSHGRGVFSTKPIKAGELLLVEKAFCASLHGRVESIGKYGEGSGQSGHSNMSELRAGLATGIFVRLQRNLSLAPAFANLYAGPDAKTELSSDGYDEINDEFVQRRIDYNVFAFSVLSGDWQWRLTNCGSLPESPEPNIANGVGVWLKASFINHSCHPTVRRSFIGDMMIWRAQVDSPANTELKFGYVSSLLDYADRHETLVKYGFTCECKLCLSEKNTPSVKMKERDAKVHEVIQCFQRSTPTDIDDYLKFIEELQSTYVFPPSQDPRRSLIFPINNLITVCKEGNMPAPLMRLGITLLESLGFKLDVTPFHWKIKVWGFMTEEVIPVLAHLLHAYETMNAALCEGIFDDFKTAYTIMTGEAESFDGFCRQAELEQLEELLKEGEGNGTGPKSGAKYRERSDNASEAKHC